MLVSNSQGPIDELIDERMVHLPQRTWFTLGFGTIVAMRIAFMLCLLGWFSSHSHSHVLLLYDHLAIPFRSMIEKTQLVFVGHRPNAQTRMKVGRTNNFNTPSESIIFRLRILTSLFCMRCMFVHLFFTRVQDAWSTCRRVFICVVMALFDFFFFVKLV